MYVEKNNKAITSGEFIFQDRHHTGSNIGYKNQSLDKKWGYKEVVLDLLKKSPEVGRLLVRLHDRNRLYTLAKTPDDFARAELTQIVIDLISFELTPAEGELIADVLMSLINQAERNLRRALAERIAAMHGVPLRMVLKLANDEIFVADPIIKKSQDLSDFDLIYIMKANNNEHWQSMAQRPNISDKLVSMLADTNDLGTAVNLAENKTINLNRYCLEKFSEMAKVSERLARPLLMREELPEQLAEKLYDYVSDGLKNYIKEHFGEIKNVEQLVVDVTAELNFASHNEYFPPKDLIIYAELLMAKQQLNTSNMLESLRRGEITNYVAQLSVFMALPVETIIEMLRQKTGQTFAIACKAKNITKADFINMFLLTTRMRGARIVNEGDLTRAIAYFTKVTDDMAKQIMSKHRH